MSTLSRPPLLRSHALQSKTLKVVLSLILVAAATSSSGLAAGRVDHVGADQSLASSKLLLLKIKADGFPFSISNTTRWEAMVRAWGFCWAQENRQFVVRAPLQLRPFSSSSLHSQRTFAGRCDLLYYAPPTPSLPNSLSLPPSLSPSQYLTPSLPFIFPLTL